MRSLPDDIPCNLVLVREPEQDTVPRHMRLPSYEEMVTKQRDEERKRDLLVWQDRGRKGGLRINSVDPAIQRFNTDKYDHHITEADCRKPKISGNTVGAAIAASINATAFVNCIVGLNPYFRTTKDPQQPKADSEGWIKHDGSGCPLPLGTEYEARRTGRGKTFKSTVDGPADQQAQPCRSMPAAAPPPNSGRLECQRERWRPAPINRPVRVATAARENACGSPQRLE